MWHLNPVAAAGQQPGAVGYAACYAAAWGRCCEPCEPFTGGHGMCETKHEQPCSNGALAGGCASRCAGGSDWSPWRCGTWNLCVGHGHGGGTAPGRRQQLA